MVVGLRVAGAELRAGALWPAAASAPPHCAAPPLRLRYVPQVTLRPQVVGGARYGNRTPCLLNVCHIYLYL